MPLPTQAQLWRRYTLLALIALVVWGVFHLRAKQRAAANSARVNLALQTYRRDLKPGINRKELERYLKAKDPKYKPRFEYENGTVSDKVQVGVEDSPGWGCRPGIDYAVFRFTTSYPKGISPEPLFTDTLREIDLGTVFGDCL